MDALAPHVGRTSDTAPILAVGGLGGMGKTALALYTAHASRSRFPGGMLFIDMRGYDETPTAPEQAVLTLLRSLGVRHSELPSEADELYTWYRHQLAPREPVLIVLDNVSDPRQVAPLLPGDSRHRVLVTSRESLDSLPVLQINLEPMHPEDAVALLDRSLRLKNPGDSRMTAEPAAAQQLVDLCGGMPLALQIAGAQLRRRAYRSVSGLVADLQAATDRIAELSFAGSDQYMRDLVLRPVFDVTYARLSAGQARLLRLMAQAPGRDLSFDTACALSDLSSAEARDQLDDLAAAFLVNPSSDGERWSMHDLLRHYTHVLISERPEHAVEAVDARGRLLVSLIRLAMGADKHLHGLLIPEAPDLFQGHDEALAWLDAEVSTLVGAALWANEPAYSSHALMLSTCIYQYLQIRGYRAEAAAVSKAALAAAETKGDGALQATAWSMLGNALQDQRRHVEAATAHTKALRLAYGLGDRVGQALSWMNIAHSMHELSQFGIAYQMRHCALGTFSQLGDEHRVAMAWNSLGTSLKDLGRPHDAVRAHHTARRIYARLGDQWREANAWLRLGMVLRDMRDLDGAANAYMNAADTFRKVGDRHGEAGAWNNTGQVLVDAGQFEMAFKAFWVSNGAYAELGAWYEAGEARWNLALLLEANDQFAEAKGAWLSAADAFDLGGAEEDAAKARSRAA
jgi:tetratricopeptide (TPR) repeat protein